MQNLIEIKISLVTTGWMEYRQNFWIHHNVVGSRQSPVVVGRGCIFLRLAVTAIGIIEKGWQGQLVPMMLGWLLPLRMCMSTLILDDLLAM